MTGQEAAALIVAVTTALGAIFAGVRNLRGDKIKADVAAAAAVLTGYTNLATTLQTELERVKNASIEDRRLALEERTAHAAIHHRDMIALRAEHTRELAQAYERIDELGAQVYALQHRPPQTRDRKEDKA